MCYLFHLDVLNLTLFSSRKSQPKVRERRRTQQSTNLLLTALNHVTKTSSLQNHSYVTRLSFLAHRFLIRLQTTFLQAKIKVGGKAGKLGDAVKVSSDGAKIAVHARHPFSKRYLKYLTKKFLKKHQLRDWLRVVSTNKSTYTLKYFDINDEASAEEN